jgi:hypothetical protein
MNGMPIYTLYRVYDRWKIGDVSFHHTPPLSNPLAICQALLQTLHTDGMLASDARALSCKLPTYKLRSFPQAVFALAAFPCAVGALLRQKLQGSGPFLSPLNLLKID